MTQSRRGSLPTAEAVGPGPGASSRATWWSTFALVAVIAGIWSLTVPLGDGPDEPAHVIKAVAVSDGQIQTSFVRRPGAFGSTIPVTTVRVPKAYADLGDGNQCFRATVAVPTSCAPGVGDDDRLVDAETYVGSYPPWYYAAVGWPSRLAPPATAVYLMRFLSALLCAAFVASAAASLLRPGVSALGAACAALAVTPAMLYLFGSVNPNSLEIAAALAVWASLLDVATRTGPVPTRLILRASVAATVLVSLRALSPAYLVGIVAVAAVLAGRGRIEELARDPRIRWAGVLVLAVTLVAVLHVVLARSYEVIDFPEPAGSTRLGLGRAQLGAAGSLQQQAIGLVSWRGLQEVRAPSPVPVIWLVATLAVGGAAAVVGRGRERVALLLVVAGTVGLPVVVAVAAASGSWQGRYALPVAVGLPALAAVVLGRTWRGRVPSTVAVSLAVFVALGWVATWERRMTRNLVGLPNGPFAGLGSAPWSGPLPPVALLVALLLGAVALPVAVAARGRVDAAHPAPRPRSTASAPACAPSAGGPRTGGTSGN